MPNQYLPAPRRPEGTHPKGAYPAKGTTATRTTGTRMAAAAAKAKVATTASVIRYDKVLVLFMAVLPGSVTEDYAHPDGLGVTAVTPPMYSGP